MLLHLSITFYALLMASFFLSSGIASADELRLEPLIEEALRNNHEVLMAKAKWTSAELRTPQAKSLSEPMFMLGYQNEGWGKYSYGEMEGAQWMFSVSQMIPFPGKLSLKGKMLEKEAEALNARHEALKLKVVSDVKGLYYDLFLIYKSLDIIENKKGILLKIEDSALARYSVGMSPQQEVLMSQTEKYMLIEKEEMLKQKKEAVEAMLNSLIGRDVNSLLGRPTEPSLSPFNYSFEELLKAPASQSPEIKAKEKMIESSGFKVAMSKKEYYPDFSVTGSVFKRGGPFEDMWSLSTTINIPIFYKKRQRNAVLEADSALSESRHDFEGTRLMLASLLRDNYSMIKTAENLMSLYRESLIPKARQNFESALSGYTTGKVEMITLIKSLTSLYDYELLYWSQFIERQKAISRIDALTAGWTVMKGAEAK